MNKPVYRTAKGQVFKDTVVHIKDINVQGGGSYPVHCGKNPARSKSVYPESKEQATCDECILLYFELEATNEHSRNNRTSGKW